MNINGLEVDVTLHQLLLDLRNSLSQNGIYMLHTIKPVGNNIMVSCPSHKNGQEKKPSCGISLTDTYKGDRKIPAGTAHCFTCDYTATLTEFISICFGYKDGGLFGNKWIKANYNVSTSRTRHVNLNFNVRTSTKKQYDTIDDNLLEPYRYTVDYMYKRGLTDDVIEQFDIGYDDEQDAITIPVPDLKGDIKWVQRRLIKHKQYIIPQGINKTDFLLGASEVIKQHREKDPVYIVESPFNMLTLWSMNYPAICLFGTGGGNQYEMLRKLPIRHYIIALDPDEAGIKGSKKLLKELNTYKILSKLNYTDSRDINELQDEVKNLKINLINL